MAEKDDIRDLKSKTKDTLKVEGKFDIMHYANNVNDIIDYVNTKLADFEIKLTALKTKEAIIGSIIDRTNNSVGQFLKENNFTKAQGLQNALITQFETYSLMNDMILKYENNIQSYLKMRLDVENNKIAAYTKIKAADKNVEKDDGNYKKLQESMDKILSGGNGVSEAFQKNIMNELKIEGY